MDEWIKKILCVCVCISIYIYIHVCIYTYIYNKILSRLRRKFYHCDNRWTRGHLLFSCTVGSDSVQPHGLQHARLPCPSPSPGTCSNSCPLSHWCYPAIFSSVIPFSYCLQSFLVSRSFPMSLLFTSGSQISGSSVSASVLPMDIQDWFPLGLTDLISLLSKGLSRVFSNTTVQKHQFFGTQPSFWSNSHIHTWLLEKP